jgi:hypothetical protein
MKKIFLFAAAASALFLAGCSTSMMQPADTPITTVPENKAVITFFRPSRFIGSGLKPLVIKKVKDGVELVGAVENGCRIRDVVDPGVYEYGLHNQWSKNLLKATVEPNKAYYVKIGPNDVGMNNAGTINVAIHRDMFADGKVIEEIKATTLREKSAKAQKVYENRKQDIQDSFDRAAENYDAEPEALLKVNTLYPEDGIKELY